MAKKRGKKEWTAASSARAARDARLATVKFLSSSELARKYYGARLVGDYQIKLRTYEGHQQAAMLSLFGGMGYARAPRDWPSAVDMVVTDEAQHLSRAQLYVISPQMCDVVVAAAKSLTVADLELMSLTDLPSPTGLLMLPEPIIVRAVDGDLADLRALTWTTPASAFQPSRADRKVVGYAAARVSSYHDTHGPVRPDNFLDFQTYASAVGTPLPPLLLDAIRTFVLDEEWGENDPELLRRASTHARTLGDQGRANLAAEGKEAERVIGEHEPGSTIDDSDGSFHLRFLAAFWRLCAQRIGEQEDAPLTHSARVAAQQTGAPPDVRVVQVRAAEHPDTDTSVGGQTWNHRWVVRMHKVRQWYPSLNTHKIIYRGPYVKGPADKPLLGGDVVRSMSR